MVHLPRPAAACGAPAGFTLIELLITIGVLAVLASVAFGLVEAATARGERLQAARELAAIGNALESYRRQFGDYPQTADAGQLRAALEGRAGPNGAAIAAAPLLAGELRARPAADDPARTAALRDPWDQPYRYAYAPSWRHGYRLWSSGPDGRDEVRPDGSWDPGHPLNRDNLDSAQR